MISISAEEQSSRRERLSGRRHNTVSNTCDQGAGRAQRSAANSNQIFGGCYGAAFAESSGRWRRLYRRASDGVVLRRKSGPLGHDVYEVAIVFGADQAETPVHLSADDDTVIARWRRYARDLGLKLIIEAQDGTPDLLLRADRRSAPGRAAFPPPGRGHAEAPPALPHASPNWQKLPAQPIILREREIIATD